MNITEIRDSGLLEFYVLGHCSFAEQSKVENAILQFPELKNDLYEIGGALEKYARLNSVIPSPNLKARIIEKILKTGTGSHTPGLKEIKGSRNAIFKLAASLMGIATLIFGYLYFSTSGNKANLQNEYDMYKQQCDSIQQVSDAQYALLNQIQDPANEFLPITPTDKYTETDIYLIYNADSQQNFVQVSNLPAISNTQSFQLWSLKGGNQAPIPLTVFQGSEGFFIPVQFEEGTATYAITIEPFGGQESPTLANLIGTVNVPA